MDTGCYHLKEIKEQCAAPLHQNSKWHRNGKKKAIVHCKIFPEHPTLLPGISNNRRIGAWTGWDQCLRAKSNRGAVRLLLPTMNWLFCHVLDLGVSHEAGCALGLPPT